jgi:hypothetical protein
LSNIQFIQFDLKSILDNMRKRLWNLSNNLEDKISTIKNNYGAIKYLINIKSIEFDFLCHLYYLLDLSFALM